MEAGNTIAHRFLIEHLAGRGGMGEVYRALDQSTGQPVAVKVLSSGTENVSRFVREARVLSSLDHPAIVRHVAHGELGTGNPYLVMEWLDGEDLADRLLKGPLAAHEAVLVGQQIAHALGSMHERGLVHRDLKPSNIFLQHGNVGHAKLLDFGIVHANSISTMTQAGTLLGTASYMAPEQAHGFAQVDARADVFSLGCVLYECLTGERAFDGVHVMAILSKILFSEAPSLREIRPGLPATLVALVDQMLAKSPDERPAHGFAVARALDTLGELHASSSMDTLEMVRGPALTTSEQRAAGFIFIAANPSTDAADDDELAAEALRYGGRLHRLFDGSAVVMLSDAPVATDLAAKAAQCALALQRKAPERKIALALGRSDPLERLPLGPAMDRAAKLLGTTSSDASMIHIKLDDVAVGLLDARFEVLEKEDGFVLRGERDVGEVRTLLGKPTPFVGRDRDVRKIEERFEECIADQLASAVLVTAPAGMGKSRLARELLQRLRTRGEPVSIWIARGQLLGAGSPLGMLSELVSNACTIRGGESLETRREKLVTTVQRMVSSCRQARLTAFLGEVIGLRFPNDTHPQLEAARRDPLLMADLIRESFVDFVKAACTANPLFMLLEDLHWGDGATVKMIDATLRDIGEKPFFVVAMARPEVQETFPRLWSDRRLDVIRLGQLNRKASEQLVRHVLGPRIQPHVVDQLVQLADGNAFYLEELIRKAADGDSEDLPATVVAMVQSRLAGLNDEARRILRAASVFGEAFWPDALANLLGHNERTDLLGNSLRNLVEQEFLTKRAEGRFAGIEEYTFRHALLREGAYAMLTGEDQTLGHRLAGEWLEAHDERDYVVLAEHFEKGGLGKKAAEFYFNAATVACTGGDSAGSIRRAEQGLAAGPCQDTRVALLGVGCEAYAWTLRNVDVGLAHAEEVFALAAPGSLAWAEAAFMKVAGHAFLGRLDQALELLPLLHEVKPEPNAFGKLIGVANAIANFADLAGMLHVGDEALSVALQFARDADGNADPMANIQISRALTFRCAYRDEDPWRAHAYAAGAYCGCGRFDGTSRVSNGLTLLYLGAWDEATQQWNQSPISDLELGHLSSLRPFMQAWLHADQGALDDARRGAEKLIESGKTLGRTLAEGHGHWILAEVLRRAGNLARADAELEQGLSLAFPLDKPGMLATLAALRLAQQRPEEALVAAEQGMQMYERIGACSLFFRGAFLRSVHLECLQATHRDSELRFAAAKYHAWLQSIADKIVDEKYKAKFFQAAPENRKIVDIFSSVR